MAKPWSEVASSAGFKSLPPDQQDGARRQYFDDVVAPRVPAEHAETAWDQFSTESGMGSRPLPSGVAPSSAGGGRGSINPGAAGLAGARFARQPSDEIDLVGDPQGFGPESLGESMLPSAKSIDQRRTRSPGRITDGDIPGMTPASVAQDVASGALQIGPTAVKGLGDLARLATGDRVGKGLSDFADRGNKAIQEVIGSRRGGLQRQRFEQDMADPAMNAGDVIAGNPGALADQILPTIGSMALPIGVAGAAGKLATTGKAAQLARAIDEATVLAHANKVREAATIGTTVLQNAGDTYGNIRDKGGDQGAAYLGAAITAPATYIAGRLTGGGAEASAAKMLSGSASGAARAIPGAMLKEGSQEVGEEIGQYVGETVGTGAEFDGSAASKRFAVAGTLGAVMGGGVEAAGAAGAARESRIKSLRDAGDASTADLFQQKHDRATAVEAVDGELQHMSATPEFAQSYRGLRGGGMKPAEAAARSSMATTYQGLAASVGIPDKAMAAALAQAQGMPLDKVPGFLHKFTDALAQRGLVQPFEGMAHLGHYLESERDTAIESALGAVQLSTLQTGQLLRISNLENVSDQDRQSARDEVKRREVESMYAQQELNPQQRVSQENEILEAQRDDMVDQAVALTDAQSIEAPNAMQLAFERASKSQSTLGSAQSVADKASSVSQNASFDAQNSEIVSPAPESRRPEIDEAAHAAATSPLNGHPEPSMAQKEAGNYRKGHIAVHGMDIAIENPKGSTRSGVSPDGTAWSNTMGGHYGYIKGTVGNDKDHVDTYVGHNPDSNRVFVIDQVNKDGSFDEHKIMMGYDSPEQARQSYMSSFMPGWTGLGAMTELPMQAFRSWVKDGAKKLPLGEIAVVKPAQAPVEPTQTSIGNVAPAQAENNHIGHYNKPLAEGGKPFKTKDDASAARKLQPMLRVVPAPSGKGFALVPKTEAQLAAQDKAAKRLSIARTGKAGVPTAAHEFIAGEGGMDASTKSEFSFGSNPKVGNRTLFAGARGGMSIEAATEKLIEARYLPAGASHSDTVALINRSFTQPQYTVDGTEVMAEAAHATRFEDHLAVQQEAAKNDDFDPFGPLTEQDYTDADMAGTGYAQASAEIQQEVVALSAQLDAMGIDAEEIRMGIAAQNSRATNQEYYELTKAAITSAINEQAAVTRGRGDTGQNYGEQGQPAPDREGQEAGLTAPSRAEVLAQQERARNAKALDDKAQIDAEASRQTLTRQSAPEQRTDTSGDMFAVEKAQAVMDKRNAGTQAAKDPNQAGMFDEPAQPETVTTKEDDSGDQSFARSIDFKSLGRIQARPASMPVAEVRRIVRDLSATWNNGPAIEVVATPSDLPIETPRDTRGLIYKGTAYVVASNHNDANGIAKTLAHEAIGHHGLWKILGKDGAKQFAKNLQLAIKSGNKPLTALSQQIRDMYVDDNGDFNLTPQQEANEIAAFAVENSIDPVTGEFKPGFGFFKQVWAKVAEFLRDLGISVKFTNVELQGLLVSSMRGLEAGKRLNGGGESMVAAGRGGESSSAKSEADMSDERTGISVALLELGKIEALYQYPKAHEKDLTGIAEAKDLAVSDVDRNSDDGKLWMIANTTPDDAPGVKSWIVTLPGGKHATLTNKRGEVYINVSAVGEGRGGSLVYDLAANYAFNNGLKFIGDPNGVSPAAMRRRLENMLSAAIKYGSTDFLAPHADQIEGRPTIGVPALRWTEGDTLGNIRSMVDASIEANEHAHPSATRQINFRPDTQTFIRGDGSVVGNEDLSDMLSAEGRSKGAGQGGFRTLQRTALFKALVQSAGARRLFLESVRRKQDSGSQNPGGALEGSFYARGIVGQTARQHTPAQLRAMANVGFQVEIPSLKDRARALWKDAGKKMAQGIVDQFAPVKDLDAEAYGLLRLAKGASGAFETFLHGGRLKLTDGVYDFDDQHKGGVVDTLLIPLQGEHHDFMRWIAANRAERLQAAGKENLFSPQDIVDLKTLADGKVGFDYTIRKGVQAGQVTRDRAAVYLDSLRVFNEFNKNVLDLAEQSGLIDRDSRKLWEHEFYVPFYRVADEDGGGVRGMNIKGSAVRQQAFKELKGGKNALNADLLDNTLMNWAHLLDASAKNRAAKATIEAAERMGIAAGGNQSTLQQMGASINNKNGVVWFMDGGQKRYSLIDKQGDGPFLMTALGALEYAGMRNPVMNAMSFMKHALTVGVTASPFFKVRNLIRDSVQVIGTSRINKNGFSNVAQGWKLTDPKSDAYFRLLAGGGTIHFGTMIEGSESKRVQALVEAGVNDATLLTDQHKVKAFYRKFIEPGITAYNELGNRGEAINRAALYDQLVKQGVSHADASLQARDLMDFSMQGSFTAIRFLTQVVPFFNARLQGLYKLGRAAKEDPARFNAVVGAAAVMSLGLLAAYHDDDDWKKREEWDRNNFWWFKFGGTAFRIPKPFEIGAVATLAERGFELAFEKEMTGKRFRAQVMALLGDNLSISIIPQAFKPILDVYANKSSFTGRPIESMGMERLKPEYRFNDRTSMTARGLSTAANAVTGLVGVESASPVQIDHMLRGYFGWLGSFVVGAGDIIARPVTGQTGHASQDIWKAATGGMVSDLRDAPSRYVSQMYTQAKEVEQAYGTWRALQKEGKSTEAREFMKDHKAELMKYSQLEKIKGAEAKLNSQIRVIERSGMDGDQKREAIRKVQNQKNRIAQMAGS